MNYDIKIIGEDEDNGVLEFDRLAVLAKSTKDIATKALMLKLRGFSDISPDKHLKKALDLRLESIEGNKIDGTSLTIDCDHFNETIRGLQYDLFKPKEEVLVMTPMALVIDSFHNALGESDEIDLDKPLLKSLMNFKKNFISDNEIFYLSNRGSIPEVKLTKEVFRKIGLLEEQIPEPTKVIVNGQLDEMKVSKGKLGLQTDEGFVNVFTNDSDLIHRILEFMGKDVTITGIANFKPNGRLSFIEIQNFGPPSFPDKFFSKQPNAMTTSQQLMFELKSNKKRSSLRDLLGKWPGDETDEEFNELLKSVK